MSADHGSTDAQFARLHGQLAQLQTQIDQLARLASATAGLVSGDDQPPVPKPLPVAAATLANELRAACLAGQVANVQKLAAKLDDANAPVNKDIIIGFAVLGAALSNSSRLRIEVMQWLAENL